MQDLIRNLPKNLVLKNIKIPKHDAFSQLLLIGIDKARLSHAKAINSLLKSNSL